MTEYCICCGREIPEGSMVCLLCAHAYGIADKLNLSDEQKQKFKKNYCEKFKITLDI